MAIQDNVEQAKNKVSEGAETIKEKLSEDFHQSGDKVSEAILNAKEKLPNITPTPPGLKAQSSAHDLKSRLDNGEPAFTILDVRDRTIYNDGHIMGAMPVPVGELVDWANSSLNYNRDIYIYGDSEEQTAQAANQLRNGGFQSVAELKGGLAAWKAIGGPTEGVIESQTPPTAGDYNLAARLAEEKNKR